MKNAFENVTTVVRNFLEITFFQISNTPQEIPENSGKFIAKKFNFSKVTVLQQANLQNNEIPNRHFSRILHNFSVTSKGSN